MKISIIGAGGNIGSAAAFNIAIQNIADELVMIDDYSVDKLDQYVFDLKGSVVGLKTEVRAGKQEDIRGSDIVLLAAGSANVVASRSEVLPQNLPIIQGFAKNIKLYCPDAFVITATNPVCPLNYAMFLCTGLDRHRLLGYSANDSIRFRMFLAEALGIKSPRLEATVVGEHGNSQVLLFSSVKVDGKPYAVDADLRRKIQKQIDGLPGIMEPQRMKTGRTAAWTTSMGLAAVCRAIATDSHELIPCSVVLDGEYHCRNMGMSVPAVLGRKGVLEIQEWKLTQDEQRALNNSVNTLAPSMRFVEDYLRDHK
jgi:malate dehydrogenase